MMRLFFILFLLAACGPRHVVINFIDPAIEKDVRALVEDLEANCEGVSPLSIDLTARVGLAIVINDRLAAEQNAYGYYDEFRGKIVMSSHDFLLAHRKAIWYRRMLLAHELGHVFAGPPHTAMGLMVEEGADECVGLEGACLATVIGVAR